MMCLLPHDQETHISRIAVSWKGGRKMIGGGKMACKAKEPKKPKEEKKKKPC